MQNITARDLVQQGYTPEHAARLEEWIRNPPAPAPETGIGLTVIPPVKLQAPTRRREPRSKPSATPEVKPADVRTWARANGIDVPARGRFLPRDVTTKYLAALEAEKLSSLSRQRRPTGVGKAEVARKGDDL